MVRRFGSMIKIKPEGLEQYKGHHAHKSQGKEKDFRKPFIFIETTYFSHRLLL